MRRVIVTGANRGLGLEFTRQLLARGDQVLAGCRQPHQADALSALERAHSAQIRQHALDIRDAASIADFARAVSAQIDGLDLLVNNAGILLRDERFGALDAEALNTSLQVNASGPFLLTQALAPLLANGDAAVVANISSQLGSIARTDSFYTPSYAISKAALNMATVLLAHALKADGVRVIALHPGWVRTDMGGPGATLAATDSVTGLLRVIDALKPEDSGSFRDFQGQPMPW